MKRSVAHLGLLPLALTLACVPAANPLMLQRTQTLAATRASHLVDAPASYEVPDWKAGSWILQRTTSDGRVSVQHLSILRADASGVVIQNDTQDDQQRTITVTTYARMPRNAEEAGDLLISSTFKEGDKEPVTIDFRDPSSAMMRGMYKLVTISGPAFEEVPSLPKEDVVTPAGRFAAAVRHPSSWELGFMRQDLVNWWHPGVPVSGTVKAESTDGKFTMELLDFGWTGATPLLSIAE